MTFLPVIITIRLDEFDLFYAGGISVSYFNHYFQMKESDIAEYVQERISFFDGEAGLTCGKIGGSDLNHVFRLSDAAGGRSVIVKQADEEVLAADRIRIESSMLKIQESLCPGQVPRLYDYNEVMRAIIMEDMSDYTVLRTGLLAHKTYPQFAEQITTYLSRSLLMTSDIVMDHREKKRLAAAFANPDLCDITENLVLGEPVMDYRNRNDIFPPVKDYVEKHIYKDEALRAELAALRFHFMNFPQALIHGNLNTGSVFINQKRSFVFNPEFAFFGPAGYDMGTVIAGIFSAWANGNAVIEDPEEKRSFCGWCMCTVLEIIDLFPDKFSSLYDEKKTDPLADSPAFKEQWIHAILADTAGYAGAECLRRVIGMDHSEDTASIADPKKRADAEMILLAFGKDLILNRDRFLTSSDYYQAMTGAIRSVEPDNSLCGDAMSILDYDTVNLDDYNHALVIIDQTKLPSRIEVLSLTGQEEIWEAIKTLRVRGAPAIGVTAGMGIYLAAREIAARLAAEGMEDHDVLTFEAFYKEYLKASEYLNSSRPTAVNLSWALRRMDQVVQDRKDQPISSIVRALHDEALEIRDEDVRVCRMIGKYGLTLVKPGDGLLTHCNAGKLAAIRYGTATAPMYLGHEQGYNFKIYCDETRPLLQGARLTSFELSSAGMDVTLLCDNMSSALMREGKINAVFTGCDRVAANGDTVNKIGTSLAALAAKRYGVPFYIAAPTSTIDMSLSCGDQIVIEHRDGREVTDMWYETPMAPDNISVFNPAFDVTDADLITGIVTEFGIAYPPYEESLKEIFAKKEVYKAVEQIVKAMEIAGKSIDD